MELKWRVRLAGAREARIVKDGVDVRIRVVEKPDSKLKTRWQYEVEVPGRGLSFIRHGGCPTEQEAQSVAVRAAAIVLSAALAAREAPNLVAIW
jgi:hypothetical protein